MTYKNLVIGLSVLALGFSPLAASAQTTVTKKTTVVTKSKTTAKAPTKTVAKAPTKKSVSIQAVKKAPTKAAPGAIADVSTSAETAPSAICMNAIKKANTFCQKVGKGCTSFSTSDKCKAANAACEDQQMAALDLCPAIQS